MNCDTQTDAGVTLPNKPMVPTAHNGFDEVPIDPLRRHIGNPLGSRDERRVSGPATRMSEVGDGCVCCK